MPPTVSQDTTQSVWGPTLGSPGTFGSGKIEKNREFHPLWGPRKKYKSKSPPNPQKCKKSKFRKNDAVSSKISHYNHMANLLRLTGELVKFSPFSSQICLAKLPNPPQDHLVRPQIPSAGVPAGHQVLGCLLQCRRTPHNHYGALPWGPLGTLGPAKAKMF